VFAAWGARRGGARQLAGLLVLLAAFAAASLLSSRIAPNVSKVATLSPEGNAGVAYLTAFCGTMILGAVLLHWVSSGLDRASKVGLGSRLLGALFGVVQGAVVLAIILYAVLSAHLDEPASAASETIRAIRESGAARVVAENEPRLRPALRLPGLVASRVDAVNDSVRVSTR
jgi:uncharacterized membrane protein required for colicin V production